MLGIDIDISKIHSIDWYLISCCSVCGLLLDEFWGTSTCDDCSKVLFAKMTRISYDSLTDIYSI
jgi:hypothetical protein